MNKAKKIFILAIITTLITTLTGCGKNEQTNSIQIKDLSIKNFKWETKRKKCSGEDCYIFNLTNKSKYDIIGIEISYKVKSDVQESQLSIFNRFMTNHEDYIGPYDSPRYVTLIANTNKLIEKGKNLEGIELGLGYADYLWTDSPTPEQFNLMEPKELKIGIVGNDKKLYLAYYEFETKTWLLDEETFDIDTWPETEIARKIVLPSNQHYVISHNENERFEFYAYGVTQTDFNNYIEKIKNLGFKNDIINDESHYYANSNDGYGIDLWYEKNDLELSVEIRK